MNFTLLDKNLNIRQGLYLLTICLTAIDQVTHIYIMSEENTILGCCVVICLSLVFITAMVTNTPLEIFLGLFLPRNFFKKLFPTKADSTVWQIFYYAFFEILLLVNFFNTFNSFRYLGMGFFILMSILFLVILKSYKIQNVLNVKCMLFTFE